MDLNINRLLRSAIKKQNNIYRKFIYWFCKHYFYCDVHPTSRLSPSVEFAHNGLGVVVNEDACIGKHVLVQHHVTIGTNGRGCPKIKDGVKIGAYAIILGDIEVGENAVIGAGAVVTKSVPANATVVGNPATVIKVEE
ncbi:MAG: serine acetyltransferase [Clostridiales bacterium]|nr:serine acetyltransferase [Clostridiales bacterium]